MSQHNEYNPKPWQSATGRQEWTEDQAMHELAVLNYPGKWQEAKRLSMLPESYGGDYRGYSYWERVHCMFLELGGCRVNQLLPHQQQAYSIVPAIVEGLRLTEADKEYLDACTPGEDTERVAALRRTWAAELAHDLCKAGL